MVPEHNVLIRSRRDVRDSEIEKSLIKIAGTTLHEKQNESRSAAVASASSNNNNNNNNKNTWESLMKQHAGWLDRKKEALMVVASLIATMAFQVGVNPPGGVWQEDKSEDDEGNKLARPQVAGESIYAYKYRNDYHEFYITNAVAFIASLSIILLLTSGLPMRRRLFMYVLTVITWIAITAIALSYVLVMVAVTPTDHHEMFKAVISYTVYAWIGLMALLLIAHTIRMIVKFVKMIKKVWVRRYARLTS